MLTRFWFWKKAKLSARALHEELLKNCEVYQQIAKSQLSPSELGLEETPEEGAMTDGE